MEFFLFIVTGCFLCLSFYFFDKTLKIQHSKYYGRWVENGKPTGFFWTPKGISVFSGQFSRMAKFFFWTFANDEWMKDDEKILKAVKTMRIFSVFYWILLLLLLITIYSEN